MNYQPIGTAPRDGSWIRLYSSLHRITSHTVRWRATGGKGPGWYSSKGARLGSEVFDSWLPAKDAGATWCEILGLARTATRDQITAAYRDKAKLAHPDAGGSHEAMTALVRARDEALAVCGR
jgi:hypothetical protein